MGEEYYPNRRLDEADLFGRENPQPEQNSLPGATKETSLTVPATGSSSQKTGQYIWRTEKDKNVRLAHAMREGKVFSWDAPPKGGHPGEDYGCRCWAEEVPENTDALAGFFKHPKEG